MKQTAMTGQNRTGASVQPGLARRMLEATEEFPPSSKGSAEALAQVRSDYARAAEPIGTMSGPMSLKSAAKKTLLLQDKLSERLAFERTGTRLYDALLSKHDAGKTFSGGPSRQEIVHIRDEEHRHFTMLIEIIRKLGGDPTMVSPSANVQAVASKGFPAVLSDPRTDVLQCLEALLVAELADNDCWTALVELADAAGDGEMTEQFRAALESEGEHLDMVRGWVAAGTGRSVEDARGRRVHLEPPTAARAGGGIGQGERRVRRKSTRAGTVRSRKRTSAKTKRKRAAR